MNYGARLDSIQFTLFKFTCELTSGAPLAISGIWSWRTG